MFMCSPNQLLLLAIATLLYAPYSEAAKITSPQRNSQPRFKEVAVTATRSEAAVNNIPANTTTLARRTLDRRLPRDEAGLFRDGPNVMVVRDLRRFGSSSRVNIPGLEDVRVVQMVDGMRLPDFYNGGPTNFTMSGR